MKKKREVAVFDFDGTISRSDSFIKFALHVVGIYRLLTSIILSALPILRWKLGMIEGGEAKEKLFSLLYKGMEYEDFRKHGQDFCEVLRSDCRATDGLHRLRKHISEGDEVYIVTASMQEWIEPWARQEGIDSNHIIGTLPQRDNQGKLTGKFDGDNCHGSEKTRRLEEQLPGLDITVAYGDSLSDAPLLRHAKRAYILHKGMSPKLWNPPSE